MGGKKRRLAAITIGQAPRVDLTPDILPLLPEGVDLVEYGALDERTFEEVEAAFGAGEFALREGDETLVSRMRDGRQAHFTERYVTPLVQAKIDQAEEEGADAVVLLCTGAFPPFSHRVPLVEPQGLLHAVVGALCDGRPVGDLVPMPDQVDQTYAYWGEHGVEVQVAAVSPYLNTPAKVGAAAARAFGAAGTDHRVALVCTDCMGFTTEMKRAIEDATGLSVVLPRTLVARVLAELLG